ncbi:integrase [Desulfobacter hydrogenophilus]|uniref:Integrase n=1 Tax=Desulfobacter hydrogenophilus TaxID=2291 RepID=A0A328FDE7_9BACT|nr:tyrosine-type recombinase/integrase [Desulfobacter hydrogenophilus]NDY71863.1 tyrosine-type recombinase/integrase [Desulfobacter hydrogenophilus]QBH12002.1 integrase [Desulfobacter hydrogenophilus]RAM02638.1 integrase [Desulfobacter hydrogenophilus]
MNLSQLATEYIIFKQSMGMRFRAESVILKAFCRAMGDIDITQVTPNAVKDYLTGTGPITTFWHRKFDALSGFYRFALSRGHVSLFPLPTTIPKRPALFQPYIYTHDQFRRLVEMTDILGCSRRFKVQPATFRTLLLLLYGTGLRIGEALSLSLADVDLPASLLTIRNTKFFKSRWVPIGPQLTAVLVTYVKTRRQLPRLARNRSAFFATRQGEGLTRGSTERIFRLLCESADIRRKDGGRFQPRLHDIRHTFALNRLISWYREGADVQRLLPFLATYLGHINVAATQRYLAMTPELLHEASVRFQRYATEGGES